MKKSKILKIFAVGLLALSAVSFVGCGHKHSYSNRTIEPTSTGNGYTLHSCSCGKKYKDEYTCLLSFESMTEDSGLDNSLLPIVTQYVVPIDTNFAGVEDTANFQVCEYRVYSQDNDYQILYKGQNIKNSMNISIVWKEKTEATEEEIEFDELLSKIKKLEEISEQYNADKKSTKNAQLRAMQYIRQTRYNTGPWNYLAGSLESDFAQYVANNQGDMDLTTLQSYANFTIPKTNEEVDFVHMISVMNVACNVGVKSYAFVDLPGWLGDIIQLAGQIKKLGLTKTEAVQKCIELFGAIEGSSFGLYDLIADLDAINIMQVYENLEEKSISSIMEQYYNSINTDRRKSDFIETVFDGQVSKEEMIASTNSRLKSSIYMLVWCQTENIDTSAEYDKAIVDKLIELFIDYILA